MQLGLEGFITRSVCNPLITRPRRLSMSPQISGRAPSSRKPTGTFWALYIVAPYVVMTPRLRERQNLATFFLSIPFNEQF